MFGVFKRLFPGKPPAAPAPPRAPSWEPVDKIDAALNAAILLFSRALEQAGKNGGKLALPGAPPADVSSTLADSVVYGAEGSRKFVTLGLTQDFRTYRYSPQFQLFMILGAAYLLETAGSRPAAERVLRQIPRALLHAHMMRAWIGSIVPTGEALRAKEQRAEMLTDIMRGVNAALAAVQQAMPGWMSRHVDPSEAGLSWSQGYPAALSQNLGADTPRLNALPMSCPAADMIVQFMSATQADGSTAPRRAVG